MGRRIDRIGERFGRLIVLRRVPGPGRPRWECRCDCGALYEVASKLLVNGQARSCGCLATEVKRSARTHGHVVGGKMTPEYKAWLAAKHRCNNPNDRAYAHYGGREIRMCDEWLHDFLAFYRSVGPRPPGLSLDRIDNNGHYAPGNCRWVDQSTQMRNRRPNPVTHCPYGHALTPDNLIPRILPRRGCLACSRRRSTEQRQRKKKIH